MRRVYHWRAPKKILRRPLKLREPQQTASWHRRRKLPMQRVRLKSRKTLPPEVPPRQEWRMMKTCKECR